jgi:hypothetical protein
LSKERDILIIDPKRSEEAETNSRRKIEKMKERRGRRRGVEMIIFFE